MVRKLDKRSSITDDVKEEQITNRSIQDIKRWLKKVRFKKRLFGVSEADVWKKIGELNTMYETALKEERARYDALLEYQKRNPKDG